MKVFIGIVIVLVIIALILFGNYTGTYNALNMKYQEASGGSSAYSAALNICSQKIEAVWTASSQYSKHENLTLTKVAEARNSFLGAQKAFAAAKNGGDTKALTMAGGQALNSALSFQLQIEAYPQLKADKVTMENMRNMQESTNEIKTSLDDWIIKIKDYNTYRGSFWPGFYASLMGNRFPIKLEYYEGPIKELNVGDLNPEK